MYKSIFYYLMIIIFSLVYFSCENSPVTDELAGNEVSVKPEYYEFEISPDSYQIEKSPTYTINYSDLPKTGQYLMMLRDYYPDPYYDVSVNKEFIIIPGDSFKVEIKNCENQYEFRPFNDEDKAEWKDRDIILINSAKQHNIDSTINYKYTFKSQYNTKGYISLVGFDPKKGGYELSGLSIGYTITPINKLWLKLDEIKWIYKTEKGAFSSVSIRIKGSTNAYRMRGISGGFGVRGTVEIPVKNDFSFEIQYGVSTLPVEGEYIGGSTELLLYGSTGLPKVITLINPKNMIQ